MKRLLGLAAVVIVAGVAATGCNVAPRAASVNGSTISIGSLNSQLSALDTTQAGQCLLEAQTGQTIQTTGTGGTGTYDMGFADAILQNQVSNTLAAQLASSKGLTITTAGLATAQTDFEALLGGEISQAAQLASQSQTASYCVSSAGQALTASAVLGAIPPALRQQYIRNNAVDQLLLADGAGITPAQILAFYKANQSLYTTACVSVIVTDTVAHANQYLAQINGGAPFASVAKASSLDTQSAPSGGSLGCAFTVASIERALSITSIPAGIIGPIQDPSTGAYELYQVTNQTVVPLTQAVGDITQRLQQSTANGNRVSKEILAFARRSDVYVNPQYGTWKLHLIVAPKPPAPDLLLAAASGASGKSLATGTGAGNSGGITTNPNGTAGGTSSAGTAGG